MLERIQVTTCVICLPCVFTLFSKDACGQFSEFTDEAAWLSAIENVTTIGFNDLLPLTIVTDQYANQGVFFTDGTDYVVSHFSLMQDGRGLRGATNSIPSNSPEISFEFLTSQYAIAVHHRDWIQFELYSEDKLVYTSTMFGNGFFDQFAGIVSTVPIDQVRLLGDLPTGIALIDNLYFGVPAPGGLALLALAALISPRRKRQP